MLLIFRFNLYCHQNPIQNLKDLAEQFDRHKLHFLHTKRSKKIQMKLNENSYIIFGVYKIILEQYLCLIWVGSNVSDPSHFCYIR